EFVEGVVQPGGVLRRVARETPPNDSIRFPLPERGYVALDQCDTVAVDHGPFRRVLHVVRPVAQPDLRPRAVVLRHLTRRARDAATGTPASHISSRATT